MWRFFVKIYRMFTGIIHGTANFLNPQRHLTMRFVYPLLLCLLTYNPSGYSYAHLLYERTNAALEYWPLTVIGGLTLITAWLIFYGAVRAAFSSKILFFLIIGVFCVISYLPFFYQAIEVTADAVTWAVIFVISGTFWFGSVFPIIKARSFSQVQVTGQVRTHEHMVDQPSHHGHDANSDDANGNDISPDHHHH